MSDLQRYGLRFSCALKFLLDMELFKAGFWLSVASVLSGILGYLYQVVMGRMLAPADFALLSAVMAFAMFLASPLNSILMLVSRKVSTLRAEGKMPYVRRVYFDAHILVFGVFLALALALCFGLDYVRGWLNTENDTVVFLLFIMLLMFAMQAVNNGFFQGSKFFGFLGLLGLVAALLKVVFSAVGVWYGFSVEGAIAGVILASAISWVVGGCILNRLTPACCKKEMAGGGKYSFKPFLPVLAANIAFAMMTQLDMVLVNSFFDAEKAGTYAAASVLGKAVLYLPGGLVLALFPLVADNHAQKRASDFLLIQAVCLTGAICVCAASAYWFFGNEIVGFLYGEAYAEAGELLRWYGLAILPLAFVLVAEHFLIAKGRVLFAWLFMVVAPLQALAIYFWHEELWQVLVAMASGGMALVILGYGLLAIEGFAKS